MDKYYNTYKVVPNIGVVREISKPENVEKVWIIKLLLFHTIIYCKKNTCWSVSQPWWWQTHLCSTDQRVAAHVAACC